MNATTVKLGGTEYVILPKREYVRLRKASGELPPGTVDALEYARTSLGDKLREAREHAGLTQANLARRLRRSQPMIAGAEAGTINVGERYVAAVLEACGLPRDWPAKPRGSGKRRRSGRRSETRPRARP